MADDVPVEPNDSKWLWVALLLLLSVVTVAIVFYFSRQPDEVERFGSLGDAVAPFSGLLSAVAVVAALWSIDLQRRELGLQRHEQTLNRKVLEEQQRQFERTAAAQEALAKSQASLAIEQREANRLAWFAELAQRRANLAALFGASVNVDVRRTRAMGEEWTDVRKQLSLAIGVESQRVTFLEERLGLNISPAHQEPSDG